MEAWLTRRWYGASAPLLLRPLSWIYAAVMGMRSFAYARGWLRSHRAGQPVVVVGNLTVGGTGKTPVVIWLAQQLSASGLRVGIVSRGYGRDDSAPRIVEDDSDWREVGDEPVLLRAKSGCLTVVAADRVAGARMLVEQGAEVIIADDGLQHLRLARDCEIVVVDGARGFGNGHLLPSGPLREPVSRLARVDAIVVNGPSTKIAAAIGMTLVPQGARRVAAEIPGEMTMSDLRGLKAHAVAGIGNPARFFADLRSRGVEVIEHPFSDHHPFTQQDVSFADELPVLMTEKDAVKCRKFANPRLWYVPVAACFNDEQGSELLERVRLKLVLNVGNNYP